MEEQVSKHVKKIYHTAKDPKHTFGEKIKEVLIEIFIIVFAVSLSIWFHSWSESKHEQKEAKEFLTGLKEDLNKDIEQLEQNKHTISELSSNFNVLSALNNNGPSTAHQDSLQYHLDIFIPVTRPNIGRYEGFKSSGKIGTIENDSLKENILVFYQQTIPDLVYGENYVNSVQLKILDLEINEIEKRSMREFITSGKTKALLNHAIYNFNGNIKAYNTAISQAKNIIAQIDKETEK